jgi:hypothetical protein
MMKALFLLALSDTRVSAVVVTEFMCHDTSKLRDVEHGEKWQADRHYSTATESKDATAIRNEGVHLADQVDRRSVAR